MAVFDIIGSYANGTVVDGPEITTEFENIYDAWNGTSTDKEMHHQFSGSDPGLIIDQLGAGPIARFRQNGIDKCVIGNDGKITNDNVLVDKFVWFINNPTLANDSDTSKTNLVPAGIGLRLTKLSIIRSGGSHTGGSSLTFGLRRNGVLLVPNIAFSDANNAINTEYSVNFNQVLAANDRLILDITITGATSERQITILAEWEQKLG